MTRQTATVSRINGIMKIRQLNDDGGRKVLQIEADWAGLVADYDDIVAAYAPVRVPGFRPGKVPRGVIEHRFQKQILDDLSHRAAQRLGREALREIGAEFLGPIEIADIGCEKGKSFRFTARFHPMPEIVLPDLGSFAIREEDPDPRDMISRRLLDMVDFTVPDELVRSELELDGSGSAVHENTEWKSAMDRVRLLLILKKIAAREGIAISDMDVEQRIKEKAIEFGTDAATLRMELEEGGGRQRLKDMLLAESTLDYLVERATHTKEKPA